MYPNNRGVQHSYLSRVTNVEVLSQVVAIPLSKLLLEQQLLAFGKVFRRTSSDPLRKAIFQPTSDELVTSTTKRRRGRPKLNWAVEVRKIALVISQFSWDTIWSMRTIGNGKCGHIVDEMH